MSSAGDPGVGGAHVRLERGSPHGELEWRAQRARHARQRLRVHAHRRRQHRHVAGKRLEGRQAEALSLGRNQYGARRVHPQRHQRRVDSAERAQLHAHRGRQRLRAIEALLGSLRAGGEQDEGTPRRQPQPRTRRASRERMEALEIDAARQHLRPGARRALWQLAEQSL